MNTPEPTLSDLENQEPQAQIDQEQVQTFVGLSIPTVLTLLNIAGQTTGKVNEAQRADAIFEAANALSEARRPDRKTVSVVDQPMYPDALPNEF